MIEIEKPQIECIETPGDASYGKYVIEPLERGYGLHPALQPPRNRSHQHQNCRCAA